MRIIDGHIVFELRPCRSCSGSGTQARVLPCGKCGGSGNGPRGGRGQCKRCYGSGRGYDHDNKVTCTRCNGIDPMHATPEDICDRISDEDWRALEFRVIRTERRMTTAEQVGMGGGFMTSVDYGAHKDMTDDVLIKDVKSRDHVQAIHIANRDTLKVADYIAIVTADQGFTVMPIFEKE